MTHYEFEPDKKRKGRNKYVGKWVEPEAPLIPLEFNKTELLKVLAWGINRGASPYSHYEISHWCGAYSSTKRADGVLLEVAQEVYAQWSLYLFNTYTREELKSLNLFKVVLPLLKPALVAALVYSFVRAMTTVSAVIFLVTAENELATTYIIGRVGNGDYGVALAYCTVLIVLMSAATALIQLVVGERKLGRRKATAPVMAAS